MLNIPLLRISCFATLVLLAGLTGCRSTPAPAFLWSVTGTVWKVTELDGEMVGAWTIPTLQLETGGNRVNASGGVNRITGTYQLDGAALSFSALVSTRMAGQPKQMEVETHFLQVLRSVTNYRASGNRLVLLAGEKVVAGGQATPATPFPAR